MLINSSKTHNNYVIKYNLYNYVLLKSLVYIFTITSKLHFYILYVVTIIILHYPHSLLNVNANVCTSFEICAGNSNWTINFLLFERRIVKKYLINIISMNNLPEWGLLRIKVIYICRKPVYISYINIILKLILNAINLSHITLS